MKAAELLEMTPEERKQKLASLKEELFHLRIQLSTGQLRNTGRIRAVKRDIARCLTVERQLAD
jgi:large subunit ribosomal protein L29